MVTANREHVCIVTAIEWKTKAFYAAEQKSWGWKETKNILDKISFSSDKITVVFLMQNSNSDHHRETLLHAFSALMMKKFQKSKLNLFIDSSGTFVFILLTQEALLAI